VLLVAGAVIVRRRFASDLDMKYALFFAALVGVFGLVGVAHGQRDAQSLARPDITMWPTLGTTVRVDPANPTIPAQMRQIQIEPEAYHRLLETRAYPDGTMLAARFHSVQLDTSHQPPLYHASQDLMLAVEVIDRSHPDGRRFYMFADDAVNSTALPPGNQCAVCHAAQGSFDGTFAHLYPATAHLAPRAE
jgi:hypothetical protein